MPSIKQYELYFESDDKVCNVSTTLQGTEEQALARAKDVARRRKEHDMVGKHVLICPDGRQIPIEP